MHSEIAAATGSIVLANVLEYQLNYTLFYIPPCEHCSRVSQGRYQPSRVEPSVSEPRALTQHT